MPLIIIFAKIIARILNFFGKGATTLPGKAALWLKYDILTKLSKNVCIICVTGTNGKTTTCALVEEGLKSSGKSYFINKSGANMISGVATSFVLNSSLFGKPKCKYAILECDENSFPDISRYIDVRIIVVTNIFRDQLDRYGEVMSTLKKIKQGIALQDSACLVINADCPLTYSISQAFNNECVTFGISHSSNLSIPSDSPYCPICNSPLKYKSVVYSQLGDYYCSSCGYERKTPNLEAYNICKNSFCINGESISLAIGGLFNVYNYLSARTCLDLLNINTKCLKSFTGAFGRMERFRYNNCDILLLLVKNPVGYSNCLSYAMSTNDKKNLIFALNDNDADGRDVSWIWDVDFSSVSCIAHSIYTFGTRSFDMALRLKYDNLSPNAFDYPDCYRLIETIKSFDRDTIIFANYTSMMSLRHNLIKAFGGEEFWQ